MVRHGARPAHTDAVRQIGIGTQHPAALDPLRASLKMRNLSQGMDPASVRPAHTRLTGSSAMRLKASSAVSCTLATPACWVCQPANCAPSYSSATAIRGKGRGSQPGSDSISRCASCFLGHRAFGHNFFQDVARAFPDHPYPCRPAPDRASCPPRSSSPVPDPAVPDPRCRASGSA